MDNEAFKGGVKLGGLLLQSEIRLIVCYIIANFDSNVKRQHIADAMAEGSIANYFETASAIGDLIADGNICEDENGILSLANVSRNLLDEIETELPLSVREKAIEICSKLIIKDANKRENRVETTESENGYYVECALIGDNNIEIMSFKIYCATPSQAQSIKEKFLCDPHKIYNGLINGLYND